jgi:hypothetical protein
MIRQVLRTIWHLKHVRAIFTRHPGMEVHSILDLPISTAKASNHGLFPSRLQYIHIQKLQTVPLAFPQSKLGVGVCAAEKAKARICSQV